MSRRPCDPRTCSCSSEDDSYLPCGPCKKCSRNTDLMGGSICRVTTRLERKALAPKEGNSNIHVPPERGPDKDDNVTRPPQIPDVNREQLNLGKVPSTKI